MIFDFLRIAQPTMLYNGLGIEAAIGPSFLPQYRNEQSPTPLELKVSTLNSQPVFHFKSNVLGKRLNNEKHITVLILSDFSVYQYWFS